MGLKRKSKPVEASVDSDDDEPLGTLLKLKGKRNSKKSKLVADGGGNKVKGVEKTVAEDEELGGMDDTLANFRKKLRGPKKDGGSAIAAGKDSSSNVVEPLCQSLNESVKNWGLDSNLISEAHKRCPGSTEGGSSGDATVMEGLKVQDKMKNKRSKVNSDAKIIGNSESDDGSDYNKSGSDALQHGKEVASESVGEALEDSLSAFFLKVQPGMIWKSRSSSRLKQGKKSQVSDDGSKPGSGVGSEAVVGKSLSASKSVKKFLMPDDNCLAASGQGSVKPTLISQSVDDCLPEVLNCTLGNPARSEQGLSCSAPDSNQIWRSTDYVDDSSRKVIPENSAFITMVQSAASSLRACSVKIARVEDGKIKYEAIEDQPGSADEPSDPNNILDRNNDLFHCSEAKDLGLSTSLCEGTAKISDDVKLDSGINTDLGPLYPDHVQLQSSPFAFNRPQKEHQSGEHDGPVTVLGKCSGEADLTPFSSGGADNHVSECMSSPMSPSENFKYEMAFRKHNDESQKVIASEHALEASRVLPEGECPPNCDDPSEDEVVNGTLYSSIMLDHQGSCAEDRGSLADPETKDSTLSVGQRAARNAKKQRHGDMAYEGDIDWEVLMQSQELFVSHQIVDRMREKLNPSSAAVDAENGKAAAVAAGLKARAVGPLEKIKFKEVLKRKGGLQEYLEWR